MKRSLFQLLGILVFLMFAIFSFGQNVNQSSLPDWAIGGFFPEKIPIDAFANVLKII